MGKLYRKCSPKKGKDPKWKNSNPEELKNKFSQISRISYKMIRKFQSNDEPGLPYKMVPFRRGLRRMDTNKSRRIGIRV